MKQRQVSFRLPGGSPVGIPQAPNMVPKERTTPGVSSFAKAGANVQWVHVL